MMLPNSCNLPVRRREEKGKRKEGKSQGRRGATTKSRVMPAVVALPSKTPSPGSTPLPPPVMVPPVATVPLPLANVLKDPTAMSPNLMTREGKQIRRKIKDKVEKDPPKTTIRKKKNSATQSISIEVKTSSENDGCIGAKNGKKKSMTNAGRRQSSLENKSDGSKESTDNDEKTPQRANKEMIKSFFQQMMSQRAKKRSDDARLETMPESSQINVSARALRKKIKKQPKTDQTDSFFKPNGDPVWMTPERSEKDCPKDEDGNVVKNPELVAALAEDNIDLEEKDWYALIDSFMSGTLKEGPSLSDNYEFDVYGTIEAMEANNEVFNPLTLTYNTIKNLYEGSEIAMKRFIASKSNNDGEEARPNRTVEEPAPSQKASTEQFQLKTCVVTNVSFDKKRLLNVKYDRHHPRASIQKFRKKLNNTCSMEQTAQNESKEKC